MIQLPKHKYWGTEMPQDTRDVLHSAGIDNAGSVGNPYACGEQLRVRLDTFRYLTCHWIPIFKQ